MKVSVIGAGAVGGMIGGLIEQHRPDAEVLLIVRGEHGEVIHERGSIKLDGPWGTHDVEIESSFAIEDVAGSDFVLITVKSQATEEAITSAAPYLGDATVISIQNGINAPVLAQHVSAERLVMGMTATNMAVLEPGSVSLQLGGASVIGPNRDRTNAEATRQAVELLNATGLKFVEHSNVLGVQYNKLAINALGYASCLSASNFITEAVCHRPWRAAVGLPIVEECLATFQQAGIELAKIPGRPALSDMVKLLRRLDSRIVGPFVQFAARSIYNKKPIVFSLHQDLLREKKTEVDYINGEVVRLASVHCMRAPYNAKIVELCHELEKRGDGTFFTREEVIQRIRNV